MKQHRIARRIGPKGMTVNLERTQCFVERHVVKTPAVIRPRGAAMGRKITGRIRNGFWIEVSSPEILEENNKLFRPVEVDGIRQSLLVPADSKHSHATKFSTFGKNVLIQQNFLGRLHGSVTAAEYAILAACLGARVVKMVATSFGNRLIRFLDSSFHFLEQLFLQHLGVLQDLRKIRVLCCEIFQNFRVLTKAHPEVIVNASLSMLSDRVRTFGGDRE